MLAKNILECVGKTPLVEVSSRSNPTAAKIFVKIESFNPGGSAKDRVAVSMIAAAEADGSLKSGGTIIEPTSGNTGIGLAMVAAVKGYRMILVMPDTMSVERIKLAKAYGAEVVLTPGAEGMKGSIAKAEELKAATPNSIIAGQFVNPANPAAHVATTGPEIFSDLNGNVAAFVAGVGTGGTLTGVAKYLKSESLRLRLPTSTVVAVEPATSPLLSKGVAGPHGLQGIGANFIPEILDRSLIDEVMTVTDEEALVAARMLAAKEGVFCGISSGAAFHAALRLASRPEFAGRNIVALLPDTGERYLSTPLIQ